MGACCMPVNPDAEERINRLEKNLYRLTEDTNAMRIDHARLATWVDEERAARQETNRQLQELIRVGERQIQIQQDNVRITTKLEGLGTRMHALELALATTQKVAGDAKDELSSSRGRLMTALTNGSIGLLFGAILAFVAMKIRGEG